MKKVKSYRTIYWDQDGSCSFHFIWMPWFASPFWRKWLAYILLIQSQIYILPWKCWQLAYINFINYLIFNVRELWHYLTLEKNLFNFWLPVKYIVIDCLKYCIPGTCCFCTHLPFGFCKVFTDLFTDRGMDVLF